MSSKLRKILACIIVIAVIIGWYITVCGVGSLQSIRDVMKFGLDINGGVYVVLEADTDATGTDLDTIMEQTRAVMEKRVNAMGISEATVSLEGNKRIRIEIPGVEDVQDAIANIGRTAQLRFLLADGTEVLTGEDVKDAGINTDTEHGGYLIQLEFTSEGAAKFEDATRKASTGQITSTNEGIADNAIIIMLDDEIITAPSAQETISQTTCVITRDHGYTINEASGTAALIRGGALPVGLTEITSSVQTATIGADALQKSITAGIVGLVLVFILMIIAYGILGVMADIALALYVLIVLWVMAGIGAVLTLPGIAALILSIGMAVDANVIIFARVREELSHGKSVRVAVSEGFRHAVVTVLDAQITTLIAAVVLYLIGSTTVKGFAITLMIGIITSIFTAIVITQILIGLLADSKTFAQKKYFGVNEDGTPRNIIKKSFAFIKNRRIFYIVSACVIVLGLLLGGIRGFNYGIDFTGGTMMQIEMGETVDTSEVEDLIKDFDLNPTLVLSGENRDQLIIKTTKALENAERIEIVKKLGETYGITEDDILASEQFGPTVGRELKSNAFRSVVIAAIGMLIYIIFRFKSWKMGVSAVSCLAHDVLFVLAMYGLFRFTINNPFIAGILTVVGYSINDTIVVFDRVRENRALYKKRSLEENLDASVNETLPRSIMTSITTLVAMLPLMIMVSTSIREFVIPLVIGVLCGTYSSVFLASPLFYEFSKGESKSRYAKQTGKK